jgi:predicted nucleic acid-binding protein
LSIYVDASFLFSLHALDAHSPRAQQLLAGTVPPLTLTDLGELEFTNALCLRRYRKELSAGNIDEADRFFRKNVAEGVLVIRPVSSAAYAKAIELARRHTPRMSVRTLDILHVACAMTLEMLRFYTFDRKQAKLAVAAGLRVP